MKIENPQISSPGNRPIPELRVNTPAEPRDESANKTSMPGQDQVKLSAAARALQASEAPFNTQKVAEIKQAIADGRYLINQDKIAAQIMAYAAVSKEDK